MDKQRLYEIERRYSAIKKTPWVEIKNMAGVIVDSDGELICLCDTELSPVEGNKRIEHIQAIANFIANCSIDVPDLIEGIKIKRSWALIWKRKAKQQYDLSKILLYKLRELVKIHEAQQQELFSLRSMVDSLRIIYVSFDYEKNLPNIKLACGHDSSNIRYGDGKWYCSVCGDEK